MRKLLFLALLLLGSSVSEAQDIQLPQPDQSCPTTLMQALQKRNSTRAFSDRDISNTQLTII